MLTSHSAEQASISSRRCEAGSIRPLFVRALRRVWPERPTISRFWPSGSIAESFTILSATLAAAVVVAEERVRMDLVKGEREGMRLIWEESLCRDDVAISLCSSSLLKSGYTVFIILETLQTVSIMPFTTVNCTVGFFDADQVTRHLPHYHAFCLALRVNSINHPPCYSFDSFKTIMKLYLTYF